MNEDLYVWKPKIHYLTDRWTQHCYRFFVWKGLNLLLVILEAFLCSQSMDVKCVGRTTLFKNESAGSRLSDVSGYGAEVIHQARSLRSLLWACCLTWGCVSLEAGINRAEAVRSWMRLGINAWCLTWAMCVCSIVLDQSECACAHAHSNLSEIGRDKIFTSKLPLSSRRIVEDTVLRVICLFQLNQGSLSWPISHFLLIRDERVWLGHYGSPLALQSWWQPPWLT